MSLKTLIPRPTTRSVKMAPVPKAVLQRKCACGGTPGPTGECESCRKKRLQRKASVATAFDTGSHAPAIVGDVLRSPGLPLDRITRRLVESRFQHDFSHVRVHTGAKADASAKAIDARAYTLGADVVFSEGQFSPHTPEGLKLLAHELAHVVQQGGGTGVETRDAIRLDAGTGVAEHEAERISEQVVTGQILGRIRGGPHTVARAPSIGTKFTQPPGVKSKFTNVHAVFDGQDFIVFDGTTQIMSHPAESGRPVSVRASDAKACGGSTTESYTNNSRYVGIQDFGAIPEGSYSFSLSEFATFSTAEQVSMITGGTFTDPFGAPLHGGDWGSGRAKLHPKSLVKSACGDTGKRSGFFLHGGSLPGSSGCIDVDNTGIDTLLKLLGGFTASIPIEVKYTHAAPTVGSGGRALGRFTYPTKDGKPIKDPDMGDRFRSLFGGDDEQTTEEPKKSNITPKKNEKPKEKPKPKPKPKSQTPSKKKRSAMLDPSGNSAWSNATTFAPDEEEGEA